MQEMYHLSLVLIYIAMLFCQLKNRLFVQLLNLTPVTYYAYKEENHTYLITKHI